MSAWAGARAGAARPRRAAPTGDLPCGAGGGGGGRRSGRRRPARPGARSRRANRKPTGRGSTGRPSGGPRPRAGRTAARRRPGRGRGRPRRAPPSVGGDGLGVGGLAQHPLAGQEPEQGRVAPGDLVEEVGQLTGDAAGDLGEGEVGKGAVGEVEAVPGQHPPAGVVPAVAQLGQQPGLADAGVAGQEHGRRGRRGRATRTQRCRAWSRGAPARHLVRPRSPMSCGPSWRDHGHRHLS